MEAADGMKCNESAYEKKCCILLIDIDYFKKINDTYGHPVGDIVLKKISRIMKAEVESIDIFARFGGEEFSVILVDSTLESAIETAERIREVVEKTIIEIEDIKLGITISIGVAERIYNEDVLSVLSRADKALYKAKGNGRNRVETS